jgi:hypothetical protein
MSKNKTKRSFLFIFGDLNYRIALDRESVICKISENNIKELLEHDQLLISKKNGDFNEVNEGEINFLPTFKFDKGII